MLPALIPPTDSRMVQKQLAPLSHEDHSGQVLAQVVVAATGLLHGPVSPLLTAAALMS